VFFQTDPLTLFRTLTPLAFAAPDMALSLLFKSPSPPPLHPVIQPPEFRQYTPPFTFAPSTDTAWWNTRPVPSPYALAAPDQITGRPWPSRNAEQKQQTSQKQRSAPVQQQQPLPTGKPAAAEPADMPQQTQQQTQRQQPPSGNRGATMDELTPLEEAVYRYAGDDKELARAMLMGALMEGGNLTGPWNSGDNGQSHGPYQIYQGAHAGMITPEESNDPDIATRFMLPKYKAAIASLRKEQPDLFETDPYLAAAIVAYRAERPAAMYPVDRQQWAKSVLEQRFRE
jgi:hypothetical protein